MTRQQFAVYLGISYESYRSYESGRNKVPRELFDRLQKEMEPDGQSQSKSR